MPSGPGRSQRGRVIIVSNSRALLHVTQIKTIVSIAVIAASSKITKSAAARNVASGAIGSECTDPGERNSETQSREKLLTAAVAAELVLRVTESCRPRPEANVLLPDNGYGDHELAAAASADGAAAQGGCDQANQRQQSRRGSHEVHHRARAGGLLARRLLLAEVQSFP